MEPFIVSDVTIMDGEKIIPNGFVKVKGKKIISVGSGSFRTTNDGQYRLISGKGKLLMPGLVNTHTHTPMTLLRGISDDLPLDRWLKEKVWPAEAKLDEQATHAGTALALVEMIRAGTTCFSDMYHLNREGAARLSEDAKMKALLSRGMIAFGTKEEQSAKLKEAVNFAKSCQNSMSGRLRGAIFPHAPYTCSLPFLHEAKAAAKEAGLPLQIHIAETRAEVEKHEEEYGQRPVKHMLAEGILSGGSLAVHATHVNEEEIKGLSNEGVFVSHNPQSNLKLGSGIAPLSKLLGADVSVSLGTDSAASNNTLDTFIEMRQAAMLHKGQEERADATNSQVVFEMATKVGADTLGFFETGRIEKGYDADFIMVNIDQPHFTPFVKDYGTIVYAASGRDVTDVFVEGEPLMRKGVILTMDEEKIRFEAAHAHAKMKAVSY